MKTQYPQTNKISRLFSMYIFKELEQRIWQKINLWWHFINSYNLFSWLRIDIMDHYTLLGNCPPTPPLSQHFALSEKYVLMLT